MVIDLRERRYRSSDEIDPSPGLEALGQPMRAQEGIPLRARLQSLLPGECAIGAATSRTRVNDRGRVDDRDCPLRIAEQLGEQVIGPPGRDGRAEIGPAELQARREKQGAMISTKVVKRSRRCGRCRVMSCAT